MNPARSTRTSVATAAALVIPVALFLGIPSAAQDLNLPPIHYETATPQNAITELQKDIATGKVKLKFEDDRGYLKSVLEALDIPESSQVVVFSKTSLQRGRISPKTPRAIYFNDDIYIGFCLRGEVMEISIADPLLGTSFYTLDQEPAGRPRFDRQTESCLICHASSATRNVPGHLVRSVHPDRHGEPMLGSGTYRTDDTSPFEERWGGWYVTGTHGKMKHMGNRVYRNRRDYDDPVNPPNTQNITDLKPLFSTGPYLTPHSDIVALMVLGHQTAVHNRIARATLETRSALYYRDELNKALKEPAGTTYDSVKSRIRSAGDDLVKVMLFSEEAKLEGRVTGTTSFAKEFAARGPFDKKGRSLRDFDLESRLFKYPCSFLIYSDAFDAMPAEVREYAFQKLYDVLTGKVTDKAFEHLTFADRTAILEILRDTKPNLPDYWR
jgi:hypothetical protein